MAISSVIARSWANAASRAVGGRAVLLAGGGTLGLGAVVFGYFSTREFVYPTLSAFSSDERVVTTLLGLLLTNVSVVVSMLLSVFLMLSPSQTALDNVLSTMPVRPSERVVGYFLPLLVITALIATAVFAPVFVSLLYGADLSPAGAMWVAFVLASHLLYAVLLNLALYLGSLALLTRTLAADQAFVRVTATLAMTAPALITFAVALWRTDALRAVTPLHHLNVHTVMIRGIIGEGTLPALFYAVSAGCAVAGLLLLWAVIGRIAPLCGPLEKPEKPRWLRSLPFGHSGLTVYLSQELRQAARHPENFLFSGFLAVLTLGLVVASLSTGIDFDRYVVGAPLGIWFSCSLFAHNSYGRTLPAHWLVQVVPRRRSGWLAAKLASNCAYCGSLAALLFAVYSLVSDGTTVAAFLTGLPHGLLLVLGLTLAGVALPYSEGYPFSPAFSALLGAFLWLPLSYAFGRLLPVLPEGLGGLAVLLLAAGLVGSIYGADRWRMSLDGSAG